MIPFMCAPKSSPGRQASILKIQRPSRKRQRRRRAAFAPHSRMSADRRNRPVLASRRMALSLDRQLAELPPDVQARLAHHRFDPERFKQLAGRLGSESAEDNFVKGKISPPKPEDLQQLPAPGSAEYARLSELGARALQQGQVA